MKEDKLSPRQFIALAFVALLSPLARRFPQAIVALSGNSAWLAPILAALPLILALPLLQAMLREGKGLAELTEEAFGKVLGRIISAAAAAWLIFSCGFILRSGAYRFVATVYPKSEAAVFIVCSAVLAAVMSTGALAALGRLSVIVRPMLLAVPIAVFAMALGKADFSALGSMRDARALGGGAAAVIGSMSSPLFILYAAGQNRSAPSRREVLPWLIAALALIELMCLACLGVLGPELTVKLNYPFFMLVRDIGIFDSPVRLEALMLALWTFADAVHSALLLWAAGLIVCRILHLERTGGKGKAAGLCCAAAAAAAALAMSGDMLGVGQLSEQVIPVGNVLFALGLVPLVMAVRGIRGRVGGS